MLVGCGSVPTPSPSPTVPISNPSISVSPSSGFPGDSIVIEGKRFQVGRCIDDISLEGVQIDSSKCRRVGNMGRFTETIQIPEIDHGQRRLSVTLGKKSASTLVEVLQRNEDETKSITKEARSLWNIEPTPAILPQSGVQDIWSNSGEEEADKVLVTLQAVPAQVERGHAVSYTHLTLPTSDLV